MGLGTPAFNRSFTIHINISVALVVFQSFLAYNLLLNQNTQESLANAKVARNSLARQNGF